MRENKSKRKGQKKRRELKKDKETRKTESNKSRDELEEGKKRPYQAASERDPKSDIINYIVMAT